METVETFQLEGNPSFRIEHRLDAQAELSIWFFGSLIVPRSEHFDKYLSHLEYLERLAVDSPGIQVQCHLENLGETISRAQHAIFRMLNAMRAGGNPVTIYATGRTPEESEHLKMSRLFVAGLSKQPGPPMKLTEVLRAS